MDTLPSINNNKQKQKPILNIKNPKKCSITEIPDII